MAPLQREPPQGQKLRRRTAGLRWVSGHASRDGHVTVRSVTGGRVVSQRGMDGEKRRAAEGHKESKRDSQGQIFIAKQGEPYELHRETKRQSRRVTERQSLRLN